MRGLDTLDFDVVRENVNINYVEYEILDDNIGYVMVFDFLGDAYEGFAEAIDTFKAANVSGMIIDLRNNGGGLVDTLRENGGSDPAGGRCRIHEGQGRQRDRGEDRRRIL